MRSVGSYVAVLALLLTVSGFTAQPASAAIVTAEKLCPQLVTNPPNPPVTIYKPCGPVQQCILLPMCAPAGDFGPNGGKPFDLDRQLQEIFNRDRLKDLQAL